jgi:hypothetical protein
MAKTTRDSHSKKWVAPRSGGYTARASKLSGPIVERASKSGRIVSSNKSAPPPGGSSVAKAK